MKAIVVDGDETRMEVQGVTDGCVVTVCLPDDRKLIIECGSSASIDSGVIFTLSQKYDSRMITVYDSEGDELCTIPTRPSDD